MKTFIESSLAHTRTVLLIVILLLVSGVAAYINIPKESNPDITIPQVYISIRYEGVSPEDSDRLLVKPVVKELRSLDGLKEIKSTATQGHASIILEFEVDIDIDKALQDVRERVDIAKADIPNEADEPVIKEINLALFPVIVVALSGDIDERLLFSLAKNLQDKLEGIPGVLEAKIKGDREELAEIIIDPLLMESYNLSQDALYNLVSRNNQIVTAGTLDTGKGRFAVKVPGVFETAEDILNLPIKIDGDRVITFKDIAYGSRTYKDPTSYARVNGKPAVTLEISKRLGSNIIEINDAVKQLLEKIRPNLPKEVNVSFMQDESTYIRNMLSDLVNNVFAAILLVMIVIIAALGVRSATLVGIAIPGSFFAGILVLSMLGFTMNVVVLFGLIMSVGMLVDGAIVVTEYAERRMSEGLNKVGAYHEAAKRMSWPIIASTATTLAVFMPLLFWPDITGEFMKFLPITVSFILIASLAMALIVVPTIGSLIGRPAFLTTKTRELHHAIEVGDFKNLRGITGRYVKLLQQCLSKPWLAVTSAIAALIFVWLSYSFFGKGLEFFPEIEPDIAIVEIRSRGDFSIDERDELVRKVEAKILPMAEIKSVYTTTITDTKQQTTNDVIGIIQIEFVDWTERRKANLILDEITKKTAEISGIIVQSEGKQGGPTQGADIQIQLSGNNDDELLATVKLIKELLENTNDITDVSADTPLPGIEWQILVDREKASRYGADIALLGANVRLVTNGLNVGTYRPDDADDEVDIRVRYPYYARNVDQFDRMRVTVNENQVPISQFINKVPVPKRGEVKRVDGNRAYTIQANVVKNSNVTVDQKIKELQAKLKIPATVLPKFRGDFEKQDTASNFLINAFGVAIFIMGIILVTQFNSFYQAFLILTAVIFSTIGVFIGLMLKGQPFGIVMSGVGVIALAGIVVNNNIVLIDTFNILRKEGLPVMDAALRTGAQRFRPVLLTTITTILGLLPMVFQFNVDFINRDFSIGAPSTQWWTQLSTAVAAGLAFATPLTLLLTPTLLFLRHRYKEHST